MSYLHVAPKEDRPNHNKVPGTKLADIYATKGTDSPIERYASTDEFKAEFGSYRVNTNTDTLCETKKYEQHDNMQDVLNQEGRE